MCRFVYLIEYILLAVYSRIVTMLWIPACAGMTIFESLYHRTCMFLFYHQFYPEILHLIYINPVHLQETIGI